MTNGDEDARGNHALDSNAVVETSLGLRGIDIDDELILVDVLSDRSFRLNSTGRRIWALLDERATVGEVAAALANEYGVAHDEARAIADRYIAQLSNLGLAAIQGERSNA